MEIFDHADDHDEYVTWLKRHWEDGLVLHFNGPTELVLHTARCHCISGTPSFGDTWTNNRKFCSENRAELTTYATETAGVRAHVCSFCRP